MKRKHIIIAAVIILVIIVGSKVSQSIKTEEVSQALQSRAVELGVEDFSCQTFVFQGSDCYNVYCSNYDNFSDKQKFEIAEELGYVFLDQGHYSLSRIVCNGNTYERIGDSLYKNDKIIYEYAKSPSSSTSSFTNKYGTSTTKCAHTGCRNYIASSGDTNCCTTHSNRCGKCGKYIDEDAMYCMDCLKAAIASN